MFHEVLHVVAEEYLELLVELVVEVSGGGAGGAGHEHGRGRLADYPGTGIVSGDYAD